MRFSTTLFVVFLFLTACKKTTEEPEPNKETAISLTETKVRHNWNFIYNVLNDYGVTPFTDTIHGQSGDYYHFKVNNTALSYWNNLNDTVNYQVLSATHLLYGGDTMLIDKLNASELVLVLTTKTDSSHYENVIRLTK